MMKSEQVTEIWDSIKNHGLSYTVVGLANKISRFADQVRELKRDNQELRALIIKIRDTQLSDQAYAEVQRIVIENTDTIEANEGDVWNINRRIDMLQRQILDMQRNDRR